MSADLMHARLALGCLLLALSVGGTIIFTIFRRYRRNQRARELPLDEEFIVPLFFIGILITFLGFAGLYGMLYLTSYAITGVS